MFAPHSHSGFYRATVSKCFLAFVLISSFILGLPFNEYENYFKYSIIDIVYNYEVWRLFTCHCAFLDTKDFICGSLLIYYFRIFERRYGSKKYLSYILCTGLISTILEMLVFAASNVFNLSVFELASGPYAVIFPFFVPFYCDIPGLAFTHIAGIPVTGKSFTYFIGLQMASFSHQTLLVSVCGIMSGVIYRLDVFRVQHWFRVPRRCFASASALVGPYLRSPAPTDLNKPIGATLEIQRQVRADMEERLLLESRLRPQSAVFTNGWFPAGVARPPDAPGGQLSEQQIGTLVDMGFSRERVDEALRATNNDIDQAMNYLLP